MIRIAIVDDEEIYIDMFREYLGRYGRDENTEFEISVYKDGDNIVENFRSQFDIILLDIKMKFVDGMTAAREIRQLDGRVKIIFITNMPGYAIKGYEVGAMDYILKPVSYTSFRQKLSRALAGIKEDNKNYIIINTKDGTMRLETDRIYYVESQKHNIFFHTRAEVFRSSSITLKKAESDLAPFDFIRGNNCYLINLAHVSGIKENCCILSNGESLELSRQRKKEFVQELTHYWGRKNH